MALIEREPCYIYSMREYQEHSLILEAISLNLGAIAILARGAKRPDSPLQGLFQPFTPLLLSLQLGQKGDLYYLKDYEYCPGGYHFVIPESFCAFYLNELLHLLYHGKESDKLLFGHYIATLEAIEHKDNIEHHLRSFELHLLKSLGYAISPLDEQGEPVKSDQSYRFCFGLGFVEVDPEFMVQVMRAQSSSSKKPAAPAPQPESDAESAMLFAKSKIRGPKIAESRSSQNPGQDAWVKRALEQGFASSVIQRYYEYGADLLGPILTGAEIQDIVSLECKLPHSAQNAKLLTASVINRLTGGVELNSRKLYREYLHLCKQKAQAATPAPAPPEAAPAPAPAAQVVAPASAPEASSTDSANAVPAPTPASAHVTVVSVPQPVVSAAVEKTDTTAETTAAAEQVAGADTAQASPDEPAEAEAPSTLETKAAAPESKDEAQAETEIVPEPVVAVEPAETTTAVEQVAGVDTTQASPDEPAEAEAPSTLETKAAAPESKGETQAETEITSAPVTSVESAETTAEQVAGADTAQASPDEPIEAAVEAEAPSSLETKASAPESKDKAQAETEITSAPVTSVESAETPVAAEQVAGGDKAQASPDEPTEAEVEAEAPSSLETKASAPESKGEAQAETEITSAPVTSVESSETTAVAEQVAGADTTQASPEEPAEAASEAEAPSSLESKAAAPESKDEASVETEKPAKPNVKLSKNAKSSQPTASKGRKTGTAQTAGKRKSKTPDLASESEPAGNTVPPKVAQVAESSDAAGKVAEPPVKPQRTTKAKSARGAKSTVAKGSSQRATRQSISEPAVKGADAAAEPDEPAPEVTAAGSGLLSLDDELMVLAPQVMAPEVPATAVKAKKVKKLTRAQLKAQAKAEAEARAVAEQERIATSPYDESMLMTLDASLNRRRRKKPAAKQ